jgi:hypothetical protein
MPIVIPVYSESQILAVREDSDGLLISKEITRFGIGKDKGQSSKPQCGGSV